MTRGHEGNRLCCLHEVSGLRGVMVLKTKWKRVNENKRVDLQFRKGNDIFYEDESVQEQVVDVQECLYT